MYVFGLVSSSVLCIIFWENSYFSRTKYFYLSYVLFEISLVVLFLYHSKCKGCLLAKKSYLSLEIGKIALTTRFDTFEVLFPPGPAQYRCDNTVIPSGKKVDKDLNLTDILRHELLSGAYDKGLTTWSAYSIT